MLGSVLPEASGLLTDPADNARECFCWGCWTSSPLVPVVHGCPSAVKTGARWDSEETYYWVKNLLLSVVVFLGLIDFEIWKPWKSFSCLGNWGEGTKTTGGWWVCPVPVAEQVGYMCSVEIKSALGQGVILSPLLLEFRSRVPLWLLVPQGKSCLSSSLPVYPEISVRGSC